MFTSLDISDLRALQQSVIVLTVWSTCTCSQSRPQLLQPGTSTRAGSQTSNTGLKPVPGGHSISVVLGVPPTFSHLQKYLQDRVGSTTRSPGGTTGQTRSQVIFGSCASETGVHASARSKAMAHSRISFGPMAFNSSGGLTSIEMDRCALEFEMDWSGIRSMGSGALVVREYVDCYIYDTCAARCKIFHKLPSHCRSSR